MKIIYRKYFVVFIFLLLKINNSFAAYTYYISSTGSDANNGLSIAKAWRTGKNINNLNLNPNDKILFEGGQTFSAHIYLSEEDSGTAKNPVIISSYGVGRATINADSSFGIYCYNGAGLIIKNLNFFAIPSFQKYSGIQFYCDLSSGKKLKYIKIDSVDVHHFTQNGIVFRSYSTGFSGYSDVWITHVNSYNNFNGIFVCDIADTGISKFSHQNFYIANCNADSNYSTGILISGIDSGRIEYCKASYTGLNGKAEFAMWAYMTRNIIFQYCTADNTTTLGADGGGFDLDGGTEDCIVQYCYTYNNYGPGFMHCDYPESRATKNNLIRYCISENDGRKPANSRCSFLHTSWGSGLDNCHFYNNVGYINDNNNYSISGYTAYILKGYSGNNKLPHIRNCSVRNNIFYVMGGKHYFVSTIGNGDTFDLKNITFQNNCYYSNDSTTNTFNYNEKNYAGLNNFQDSTQQEMQNTQRTGFVTNPHLYNPGNCGLVSVPTTLITHTNYKIHDSSSIFAKGLNTDSLFTKKQIAYDFYGEILQPNHIYTPGVHEPQPNPQANFTVSNICLNDTSIFNDSSKLAQKYLWNFGDGDSSDISSPKHIYTHEGIYIVKLIVTSKYMKTDTLQKNIEIYSLPTASFTETHQDENYTFTAIDSVVKKYKWNFGDSIALNGAYKISHKYKNDGKKYVVLEVENIYGCKAFFADSITVKIANNGVENIFENNMQIFPNPGNGIFRINAKIKLQFIEIFNILGEKVYSEKLNSGREEMDLSSQPQGVYFYRLKNEEQVFATGKLVIQ